METKNVEENFAKLCPLMAFNSYVGGKYKLWILWDLRNGPLRYGELKRSLTVNNLNRAVTPRTLSRELKELQARKLIKRKQYATVPPKVEYSLNDLSLELMPIIKSIISWGLRGVEKGTWPPKNC